MLLGVRARAALGLIAAFAAHGAGAATYPVVFAPGTPGPEQKAVLQTLEAYVRAIEGEDIDLFRSVIPGLSDEEEQRARKAFATVDSHTVEMTVEEIEVRGEDAVARARRRDTINGSIVSSFPQMFRLRRAGEAWIIREIGR